MSGSRGKRLKTPRCISTCTSHRMGQRAMAFLKREGEHANAPRPDLILLDLNLPKKDGREVLEEIKESPTLKSIPVVILTTSASEADILRSYRLHANCYITKPVDLDGFLESREEHRQFLAVRGQAAARSTLMKEKTLQVLVVEDNAGDARLLREMFSKEKPGSFELTHLLRMSEAVTSSCERRGGHRPVGHGIAGWAWSRYRATGARGGPRRPGDCANGLGRRGTGRRSYEGRRARLSDQRPDRKSRASPGSSPCHRAPPHANRNRPHPDRSNAVSRMSSSPTYRTSFVHPSPRSISL